MKLRMLSIVRYCLIINSSEIGAFGNPEAFHALMYERLC